MQTRRDQLHAYRFLTRRALAALVTGEPNAVEPPMRRLTVTTLSGVMIAILVGVVFALLGLIRPSAGDSWKAQGTVVVERETGARYIYRDGKLDPVLNYSSGVLAVSGTGTSQVKVVLVDRSDIADTPRGPTIGIDGIPDSLPGASDIVAGPWTVCSRQRAVSATRLTAAVSVSVGPAVVSPTALPGDAAVLAAAPSDPQTEYLLWHGLRYRIGSGTITSALRVTDAAPLTVGTAFLQALDEGTPLVTPTVAGLGSPGPSVDGHPTTVGQLVRASNTDQYSVVLRDGVQPVTALQAALLRTEQAPPELDVSGNALVAAQQSAHDGPALLQRAFAGLPADLPSPADQPRALGDLCAVFSSSPRTPPRLATVRSELPPYEVDAVAESAVSAAGRADTVTVSPGRAALVRSADNSPTVFAVATPGRKYAFAHPSLLAAFGYDRVTPTTLPGQLLPLVPTGPALDPAAALTPVTG